MDPIVIAAGILVAGWSGAAPEKLDDQPQTMVDAARSEAAFFET